MRVISIYRLFSLFRRFLLPNCMAVRSESTYVFKIQRRTDIWVTPVATDMSEVEEFVANILVILFIV
ncbi:hypothetical protein HZS_4034 [Henneguya salminicola]|nr:hypothetical protein HZS_4034 [Henneguya salminicola]